MIYLLLWPVPGVLFLMYLVASVPGGWRTNKAFFRAFPGWAALFILAWPLVMLYLAYVRFPR